MGLVVEQNRAVDDGWIRPELIDPQDVAKDNHAVLSGLILVGKERAPSLGLDAVDIEVMRRDACASQLDRVTAAGKRGGAASLRRHEVEDDVVSLPVEEVQRGNAVAVAAGWFFEHTDDPIGVPVRKGFEQDAIDEAENRGVAADAEGQRQNGHRGKRRRSRQRSAGIADILDE